MKLPKKAAAAALALGLLTAVCTAGHCGPPTATSVDARATESNITRLTTSILERSQFAHHPLDAEFAGKLLDGYLDALDPGRALFLGSDVSEFAAYRASLPQATRSAGDTSAARAIFARFLQRMEQRATYVAQLLKTPSFDFTGNDAFSFDREHAERPKDLVAAQALWRQQLRAEYLQEKLTDAPPEQIQAKLSHRYSQRVATMKSLTGDEVLEIYLNALAHVYDPHSDYLGHEEMESLAIAMNLSLFGIGASLENADGYCKVREVLPGGPAARGGQLKPGDRIVAVAQAGKEPVDIVNMPLTRAVDLIRGPKGSTVVLTVLPDGAPDGAIPKKISIVRDQIQLEDQQANARVVDLTTSRGKKLRLGVIDVPSFYADMGPQSAGRSVTADVAKLVTRLKTEKVKGIVLDLRRNGGGSLKEAISLTGLFIRKGPVVQTRSPGGTVEIGADTDPAALYEGPLVLLTSRFSASASEILAGALQDYGRALVVGDSSTFGKGTVQSVMPLARVMDEGGLAHTYDPGALKVTIQKFYRPSGASTQLRGVTSDIVLPSTSDFSDVSESAMKDPLPWDTIPAAAHEQENQVAPYVAALREGSRQRVATEKDFAYLAEDVARLKKDLTKKSISLNEAERRKDMAESKARQAARAEASKALLATRPPSHVITLKDVGKPGLSAPTPLTTQNPAAHPPSGPDADGSAAARSFDDDVLLNETVRILADYAGMLQNQPPRTAVPVVGEAHPRAPSAAPM